MEKEYRFIYCEKCQVEIRKSVTKRQIGKIIVITCPQCKTKYKAEIIDQAFVEQLVEELKSRIEIVFSRSPLIKESVRALNSAYNTVDINFVGITKPFAPIITPDELKLRANLRRANRRINIDIFNDNFDDKFSKKLKIDLVSSDKRKKRVF